MNTDQMYEIASQIAAGQIGVMPTDTIFGLVGNALEPSVVERIYQVKQRQPDKPYVVLIGDVAQLRHFDIEPTAWQWSFLDKHWPGPVSIGLACPAAEMHYLHRGTHMLVLRLPDDENLRTMLINAGPIIATSANLAGQEPATTLSEIKQQLPDLDFYIDGTTNTVPSRIALVHADNDVEWIR